MPLGLKRTMDLVLALSLPGAERSGTVSTGQLAFFVDGACVIDKAEVFDKTLLAVNAFVLTKVVGAMDIFHGRVDVRGMKRHEVRKSINDRE